MWPGPEVIKLFSCSTQLSTKFILLINVKMPTIVGILTFISMINTTYESFESKKKSVYGGILVFMSSCNFVLSWVEHEKSFITSGPGPEVIKLFSCSTQLSTEYIILNMDENDIINNEKVSYQYTSEYMQYDFFTVTKQGFLVVLGHRLFVDVSISDKIVKSLWHKFQILWRHCMPWQGASLNVTPVQRHI